MNIAAWREVTELECKAEQDELERWMSGVSIEEAVARNFGLRYMEIVELTQGWFGKVRIIMEKKDTIASFKSGQVFTLSPTCGSHYKTTSFSDLHKVCQAVVLSCSFAGRLVLSLEEAEFDKLMCYIENSSSPSSCVGTYWELALVGSEVTNRLRRHVLNDLDRKARHPCQQQLFHKLELVADKPETAIKPAASDHPAPVPDHPRPPKTSDSYESLNDSQKRAINQCLQEVVCCIHGPPGTGKTTTVAALIRVLFDYDMKVLITGPSNISVDNILKLCVADPHLANHCLRLGHPARQNPHLRKYAFVAKAAVNDFHTSCVEIRQEIAQLLAVKASGDLKSCTDRNVSKTLKELLNVDQNSRLTKKMIRSVARNELQALRGDLFRREKNISKDLFASHKLVFATCAGSMTKELRSFVWDGTDDRLFDVVIIDEAAKATVIDSLMPCMLGKKVILAGDHMQLRATVKSTEAIEKGFDVSLMERVVNSNGAHTMLNVQYRMNKDIMKFSSDLFYHSELLAHQSVANRYLDETTPGLLWLDTADVSTTLFKESTTVDNVASLDTSKYNIGEAVVVVMYLRELFATCSEPPPEVGVIAPYARQVKLLQELIRDELGEENSVSVCTVDGFQGREADVIILSLVRSNTHGNVGFLQEPTRINVSVTRARKHCCIVADSNTVKRDDVIKKLFSSCEVKSILEDFDFDELEDQIETLQVRADLQSSHQSEVGDGGVTQATFGGLKRTSSVSKMTSLTGTRASSRQGGTLQAPTRQSNRSKKQSQARGGQRTPKITPAEQSQARVGAQKGAKPPPITRQDKPSRRKSNPERDAEKDASFEASVVAKLKMMNRPNQEMEFAGCSGYERLIIHKAAEELRLHHVSVGEGSERKLIIRRLSSVDRKLESSPAVLDPGDSSPTVRDKLDISVNPIITFGGGEPETEKTGANAYREFGALLSSGATSSDEEVHVAKQADKASPRTLSSPLVLQGAAKQKKAAKLTSKQEARQAKKRREEEIRERNRQGLCGMDACKAKITLMKATCGGCKFAFCFGHVVREAHKCTAL